MLGNGCQPRITTLRFSKQISICPGAALRARCPCAMMLMRGGQSRARGVEPSWLKARSRFLGRLDAVMSKVRAQKRHRLVLGQGFQRPASAGTPPKTWRLTVRYSIVGMIAAIAVATAASSATDFFDGLTVKEMLTSPRSKPDVERCMLVAGVSAYPVNDAAEPSTSIFFLTLQTLSGRNPPVWRLSASAMGSKLEVYDGRRYLKRARNCFTP